MKIVNPLNYPLAILAGGIVLFIGVRLVKLPSVIILPLAAGMALGSASFLQSREGQKVHLENPALEKELANARQQASLLIEKSENLRLEARKSLENSWQLELLTAVEYACDRTLELPSKIEQLTDRLYGGDSLLSVAELEQQLKDVRAKQTKSKGVALQQLRQIEESLKRNINLANQGQDARQAQVFSVVNLITESAGVLQQLQNRLRDSDLSNSDEINDLRNLSQELSDLQENVSLFMQ